MSEYTSTVEVNIGMPWDYFDPKIDEGAKTMAETPMEMVREFTRITQQEPDPKLYFGLICEEYQEFTVTEGLSEGQLKELADLVYVCYGFANAYGYDLDEALKRVHENNVGRCIQPDGSIQRREDGKILKNLSFPKVDLKDLIP